MWSELLSVSLFFLSCLYVVATVLPLAKVDAWWVRMLDFPRLHLLFMGLALIASGALAWRQLGRPGLLALGLVILCALYQASRILPFTPLWPKQIQGAQVSNRHSTFRLLSANVLMSNRDAAAYVALIQERQLDVALFLETSAWWEETLRVLEHEFPYRIKQPQENGDGMLLYSRLELANPQICFLARADVPSIHARLKLRSGEWVRFYGVHPMAPRPSLRRDTTPRDEELLSLARLVRQEGGPAVVVGDLNDVGWSHTTKLFQRLSGMLDPRIGRGLYNTFNANSLLLRFPIDHIFLTHDFRLLTLKRTQRCGSDHFPILAALSYEPQASAEQKEPAV